MSSLEETRETTYSPGARLPGSRHVVWRYGGFAPSYCPGYPATAISGMYLLPNLTIFCHDLAVLDNTGVRRIRFPGMEGHRWWRRLLTGRRELVRRDNNDG